MACCLPSPLGSGAHGILLPRRLRRLPYLRCVRRLSVRSPMGYESFDEVTITRQVVIGGKNKYLINGRTVQQSQVTNLFHSVQLNVNNPHFLIMQARRRFEPRDPVDSIQATEMARSVRSVDVAITDGF